MSRAEGPFIVKLPNINPQNPPNSDYLDYETIGLTSTIPVIWTLFRNITQNVHKLFQRCHSKWYITQHYQDQLPPVARMTTLEVRSAVHFVSQISGSFSSWLKTTIRRAFKSVLSKSIIVEKKSRKICTI